LGKVWANRIAERERAVFQRDLESFKSELAKVSEDWRDALTRKRNVYGQVAGTMRVFLASSRTPTVVEKDAFLLSFDHAVLWASEDVAQALVDFLNQSVRNASKPGSVTNEQFKDGYRACLNAMRRDCGYPNTRIDYPVLTFN
jgi:hypothetical protein